jgi:dTDP-4-dehydrorhamnose reductase
MNKTRILFTGSNGMLARDLIPLFGDANVYAFDRSQLDITNKKEVEAALLQIRPNIVVNCAAFTKVDNCEIDPTCYKVNSTAVHYLAKYSNLIKAKFVHFSTDYVFDGNSISFYKENDDRSPINHYGHSKFLGELALENEHGLDYLLLRVQWLFGINGPNFVDTMLKIAEKNKVIKVVNDQFGRPTSTFLLSKAIHYLITSNAKGCFHLGSSSYCSWYDFAKEILKNKKVEVIPCNSEEFPRPAKRPKFGVLDVTKMEKEQAPMYSWDEHLASYLGKCI